MVWEAWGLVLTRDVWRNVSAAPAQGLSSSGAGGAPVEVRRGKLGGRADDKGSMPQLLPLPKANKGAASSAAAPDELEA